MWSFWKWYRWKSTGFCLWPAPICKCNLKVKFLIKLDLRSGNHVVYKGTDRQTDGQCEFSIHPPTSLGRGYNYANDIPDYYVRGNTLLRLYPLLSSVVLPHVHLDHYIFVNTFRNTIRICPVSMTQLYKIYFYWTGLYKHDPKFKMNNHETADTRSIRARSMHVHIHVHIYYLRSSQ